VLIDRRALHRFAAKLYCPLLIGILRVVLFSDNFIHEATDVRRPTFVRRKLDIFDYSASNQYMGVNISGIEFEPVDGRKFGRPAERPIP
jgi:hypothetical protein